MPDAAPDRTDLEALLSAAASAVTRTESAVTGVENAVSAHNALLKGRDRSRLALIIIGTYGAAVTGAFLFILFTVPDCTGLDAAACSGLTGSWDRQAVLLRDLITAVVLPIVTLMLGFYFGTERAERPENG